MKKVMIVLKLVTARQRVRNGFNTTSIFLKSNFQVQLGAHNWCGSSTHEYYLLAKYELQSPSGRYWTRSWFLRIRGGRYLSPHFRKSANFKTSWWIDLKIEYDLRMGNCQHSVNFFFRSDKFGPPPELNFEPRSTFFGKSWQKLVQKLYHLNFWARDEVPSKPVTKG